MRGSGALRSAAAVGAFQLAVAGLMLATAGPSGGQPVPGTDYRWVDPPEELPGAHERPSVGVARILIEGDMSLSNVVTTSDGQALATFEAGAVAPNPPDRTAEATLVPFDSATLGALPNGL